MSLHECQTKIRQFDSRSGMEGAAVIPNRDVVLAPALANMEVVVLRDMSVQVIEGGIRFVWCKFDD